MAVGGGTRNQEWMQIISDIANIEMVIPEQQIGSSYGDAFMAGVGVGIFKDLGEITNWVSYKTTIKPNREFKARYDNLYGIFRGLYRQTKDLMHNLAELNRT